MGMRARSADLFLKNLLCAPAKATHSCSAELPYLKLMRGGLPSTADAGAPRKQTETGTSSRNERVERQTGEKGETIEEIKLLLLAKQAVACFCAGAVLGPLCDGQHSSHDVLHYADPVKLQLTLAGNSEAFWQLETCWWVPLLFGLAGIILGVSHPVLDRIWQSQPATKPTVGTSPSWLVVNVCISAFVLHYWASGALEDPLLHTTLPGLPAVPAEDAVLAAGAAAIWAVFDRTRQGLAMALATAVAGPLIEMLLINQLHLYHYLHPQVLGTPSWICWVYFAGGPAVGNLGRKTWSVLASDAAGSQH